MQHCKQGLVLVTGCVVIICAILAMALAWGPHHCDLNFPQIVGCTLGSYETLSSGLIAAAAAIFAGWLAWSAVQIQIDAESKRANADRNEVEKEFEGELDTIADAASSLWRVIDDIRHSGKIPPEVEKVNAVVYGIEEITKDSWIRTSGNMAAILGWSRRRKYERLIGELVRLQKFKSVSSFDAEEIYYVLKDIRIALASIAPEIESYFEGLFARAGKAWDLGYAIERMAESPEK